jgi:hypothetical protein
VLSAFVANKFMYEGLTNGIIIFKTKSNKDSTAKAYRSTSYGDSGTGRRAGQKAETWR